jgi:hypothetical protein
VKIETAARTLYFLNAKAGKTSKLQTIVRLMPMASSKPMAVSPWGFNEVKGTRRRRAIFIAQASGTSEILPQRGENR